jgi:hypothetical protein
MKIINTFTIDTSDLPQAASTRRFTITGDIGSEASLQVINSSQQFYNFSSKSFTSTFNSQNNLSVKMKSDIYSNSILFPASGGSGDSYTILLIAPPDKDTQLEIGGGKHSYSTVITQNANATLTFTIATANTNNYTSWSSGNNVTSTGSPGVATSITKTLDWTLRNAQNDTYGFGLRLIRQPLDTDWYYEKDLAISSNPAGDAVSNNTVTVADLTDIGTGMELVYHKGTTAPSATTTIIAIDTSTNTITFSTSTAFEDGETMTLRAKGSSVIQKAIGANIDFSNFRSTATSAVAAELTKTVRTTATDSNIALNGTYGLSGGGFVKMSGRGVNNTAENLIQVVTASSSAGSILTEEGQTVKVGTKMYFKGSTQSIDIDNTFTVKSHPSANKTIYLNLDNFITPGVSGS